MALTDEVHTTLPDGSQGHLLAARLRQPTEATFEAYLADLTIEKIGAYAAEGKPFYLNCHFFGPHLPYLLPDEWYDLIDPDDIDLPASMAETFADKPSSGPTPRTGAPMASTPRSGANSSRSTAATWR